MCLEVKSDYQKSSWLKSLFHETNLGFWGLSRKMLKMKPLRLAKNEFPVRYIVRSMGFGRALFQ